jgi:hypothetical protein
MCRREAAGLQTKADWWIAELRELGAKNVDPYERKLRSFDQNEQRASRVDRRGQGRTRFSEK